MEFDRWPAHRVCIAVVNWLAAFRKVVVYRKGVVYGLTKLAAETSPTAILKIAWRA